MSKIRVGSCLSFTDNYWQTYANTRGGPSMNAASCIQTKKQELRVTNSTFTTLFQSQCVLPTRIAITKAQCYNTGNRCRQQLRQIGTYAHNVHCHNIPKFSRHILGYSPALKRPLHLLHVPATKVHAHIFFLLVILSQARSATGRTK